MSLPPKVLLLRPTSGFPPTELAYDPAFSLMMHIHHPSQGKMFLSSSMFILTRIEIR